MAKDNTTQEDFDEEEPTLEKDIVALERRARREKLDGPHVRYLRDVVASERAFNILNDNAERFGPLEDPDVADLRRDPQRREARVQELRQVIEDAQRELTQLDDVRVQDERTSGQAPKNPDGGAADLGNRQDEYAVREARYKSMTVDQLRAEIEGRNGDGREEGDRMNLSGTKPDLVARLLEDDEWLAELDEDENQ